MLALLDQASTAAQKVDDVFFFILALCVAFLIFITFLMVYFVIRYSRKRHPKGKDIEGHAGLEIAWTVIPLLLFLVMFWYGWTNFEYMRNAPRDAMVVEVTARQWAWQFRYPNDKRTDQLYVALDRPVRLEVRSVDVVHGFYVPAFRLKMDAVPGKENYTWFIPSQLGSFDIQCTVICGTDHSAMLSHVVVLPEDDLKKWYFGGDDAPLPAIVETASALPPGAPEHPGFAVLSEKQCLTCHSTDGRVMVGPTFKGVFGTKEVVKDPAGREREVVVDDAFLRRSMQDPMAEVLRGYPPAMPKAPLSDQEVAHVIDYIRSLQ